MRGNREQGECHFKWGEWTKSTREQGGEFLGSREKGKMEGKNKKK